jgi:excisionase family DNA binding protein
MIEILTPDEVAELLRLSPNRVLLLARRGEIPSVMIDGRFRFDAGEIEDWIKARRSNSLRTPPRLVGDD